jgi:uncharacterized protein (DUF433 family)
VVWEVVRDNISSPDSVFSGWIMFDRVTFDAKVLGGRACIRGLRIPVSLIVSQVAHGATPEEILKDYPDLEREDLRQAMEYAAWLASEEIHPASR